MGETLRGVLFGALLGGGAALGLASVGGKRNPVGLLEKTVYVYQDSTFGSALNECATLFTKVDTKATQQLIRDCDSLVGLFSRVSDPDGAHSDAFSEALILRRSVVSLVVGLEKKSAPLTLARRRRHRRRHCSSETISV